VAEQAAAHYPDNSLVWLWLGDADVATDPSSAIRAYQAAIKLDPANGTGWCRLGSVFEKSGQTQDSLDAYLNCCRLGDPGYNGCYGAGRMFESLGNISQAITAYRSSAWLPSIQRGDALESRPKP
jgi:cytochrome c-type biogenesis protein CcmH/NrfG